MSRVPIIAANWKMNKVLSEALSFIDSTKDKVPSSDKVLTVVCAPALFLNEISDRAEESHLKIGAQTMHFEDSGAFTGEISPKALEDIGVTHVIIGHSERRELFNETNQSVNKKMHAAFKHNLNPIMCCGETLAEREEDLTEAVIRRQVNQGFEGLSAEQVKRAVIAYEPIWAIGTGRSSSAPEANETCRFIRQVIAEQYNESTAQEIRIQYGGSVKPDNISGFLGQEHIDGALVGGASLNPETFLAIVEGART